MENFFNRLHPLTILLTMLAELVIIIVTGYDRKIAGLLVLCLIALLAVKGYIEFFKGIRLSILLALVFAVFNCIFYHEGAAVFLYVNDRPLTVESLLNGVYSGMLAATLIIWFKLFNEFVDNDRLIYFIRKPFPTIALIISMVFYYTDFSKKKIDKIREALFSFKNSEDGKIKASGNVFSVLISVLLFDSVITAKSMRARGYGSGKKTSYRRYKILADDLFVIAFSIIAIAIIIYSNNNLAGDLLLFIIPIIYNCFQEAKWKLYLSRI